MSGKCIFLNYVGCVFVSGYVYVGVGVGACGDQKSMLGPIELDF